MIAGISPEDIRVMRDESDWVAEQLQRLERTLYHVSQTRVPETPGPRERTG